MSKPTGRVTGTNRRGRQISTSNYYYIDGGVCVCVWWRTIVNVHKLIFNLTTFVVVGGGTDQIIKFDLKPLNNEDACPH